MCVVILLESWIESRQGRACTSRRAGVQEDGPFVAARRCGFDSERHLEADGRKWDAQGIFGHGSPADDAREPRDLLTALLVGMEREGVGLGFCPPVMNCDGHGGSTGR